MAEMMELAQPGPEHAELATYAGEWESEVLLTLAPGAEPVREAATATSRMVLGGRFLQMESKGAFMGQPVESLSMLGFDRRHGTWTTVGFDTLGTYWVSASGRRDDDGVIRMHGRDDDPTGAQVFYFETRFVSDDEFVSTVNFTQHGGQAYDEPFRMVEVRYKRK
jgi:hypothetical protein